MLYLRYFHAPYSIVKLRIDFHQNSWNIPPPKKKPLKIFFLKKLSMLVWSMKQNEKTCILMSKINQVFKKLQKITLPKEWREFFSMYTCKRSNASCVCSFFNTQCSCCDILFQYNMQNPTVKSGDISSKPNTWPISNNEC